MKEDNGDSFFHCLRLIFLGLGERDEWEEDRRESVTLEKEIMEVKRHCGNYGTFDKHKFVVTKFSGQKRFYCKFRDI